MRTGDSMELLTMSFRGDYEVCRVLCESVDRFVPQGIEHCLIVPRADLDVFASLANHRRRLIAEEDILPPWFFRIPMPSPQLRRLLGLPRRNVYFTPFSLPVRGWIAQQIMKIAAAAKSQADIVIHIDSDGAFIRPFSTNLICRDGKVRIYRDPSPVGLETHVVWQQAAGALLGLEDRRFYGGEYIDQFVVWKPSVVRGMVNRLQEVSGYDWVRTLARSPHFAEYVLYGVYADQVVGFDAAGLVPQTFSMCHSMWDGSFSNDQAIESFVHSVEEHHVLCLLQSTLSESMERRREVFRRVTEVAALQERRDVS